MSLCCHGNQETPSGRSEKEGACGPDLPRTRPVPEQRDRGTTRVPAKGRERAAQRADRPGLEESGCVVCFFSRQRHTLSKLCG